MNFRIVRPPEREGGNLLGRTVRETPVVPIFYFPKGI